MAKKSQEGAPAERGRPRKQNVNEDAKQFRILLERAGFADHVHAGEILACSERTVRGYADGTRPIPEIVTRFLKAYVIYGIKLERLLKPLPKTKK